MAGLFGDEVVRSKRARRMKARDLSRVVVSGDGELLIVRRLEVSW